MGIEFTIKLDIAPPEARIIAEDDTYAVIAVRIEKAWLTRNIRFLAALADCTVVPSTVPTL